MNLTHDLISYGAKGDGVADDTFSVTLALKAALLTGGRVYVPAGRYRLATAIGLAPATTRISIDGDGQNVSVFVSDRCDGLSLSFEQSGIQQWAGVCIRNVGFAARGKAGRALRVSYGAPKATSDHYRPSVVINNVAVESSDEGSWAHGIEIEGAWNPTFENVYVSGDACGGKWSDLSGHGVTLKGMCVNAHLANVRCNFWAVGLHVHAELANTEGIFCSNCSMVAVKRGVWIKGNPYLAAPRISSFTWIGGMIECRVGGVRGGSAAFHLQHVWTALISGCQMLAETISENLENTYGVVPQDCSGVVVTGCDINAWTHGVLTTGACSAINVAANTFTNVATQVCFGQGTKKSRSYGAVLFNNAAQEFDMDGSNQMGFRAAA